MFRVWDMPFGAKLALGPIAFDFCTPKGLTFTVLELLTKGTPFHARFTAKHWTPALRTYQS